MLLFCFCHSSFTFLLPSATRARPNASLSVLVCHCGSAPGTGLAFVSWNICLSIITERQLCTYFFTHSRLTRLGFVLEVRCVDGSRVEALVGKSVAEMMTEMLVGPRSSDCWAGSPGRS